MFSADELAHYSRQITLKEIGLLGQEKLKNARILCIGLGGLGSPLLIYLAAAGVGTLGVVDDDTINLSNLHRQILYRLSQVGQRKTDVAKKELLAINPFIKVQAYPMKLIRDNAEALIGEYDIIADGSDNFYTRYLIHDVSFKLNKPYVYASVHQFQGYCSIFYGKDASCLRCLFPNPPAVDYTTNCSQTGVLGMLPGLLGLIQATEIIKWIVTMGLSLNNRLLMIDLLTMRFENIHLTKNPECKLCVHNQSLEELWQNESTHLVSCIKESIDLKNHVISAQQLAKLLESNSKTLLLDVRTEEEHANNNLGGIVIPLAELRQRLHELEPECPIVLYCQSGKRSTLALQILLEAGFSAVKCLAV